MRSTGCIGIRCVDAGEDVECVDIGFVDIQIYLLIFSSLKFIKSHQKV